jgi:hypothetical protein
MIFVLKLEFHQEKEENIFVIAVIKNRALNLLKRLFLELKIFILSHVKYDSSW